MAGSSGGRSIEAELRPAVQRLFEAGVANPSVDAELLLCHILNTDRGSLQAAAIRGAAISDRDAAAFAALVDRRASREPLQHITGTAAFRSLLLAVGPGVFVPRPETELVTQFAIDALRETSSAEPIAVDLGTGSGAIAISLALEVPHARVVAVEKSAAAFAWAAKNAAAAKLDNLQLEHADLADCLPELDGRVDVVISNPPYIPRSAIPRDPEVHLFDPDEALYGGEDGLDVVREVSRRAAALLRTGGALVLEHGELQREPITRLLSADGWRAIATHPDLVGRDRATTAVRAPRD